jgi:hypothetical protein
MEAKDILGWCFTIASLVFGVFGFLYSTYATAMLQAAPAPPITRYLRRFCWLLAFILVVLTGLAGFTSYDAAVGLSTWLIVGCFVILTVFSVGLAFKME